MPKYDRYLCMGELTEMLSVTRRTVYRRLHDDPSFPAPFYIGARAPRWSLHAVNAWLRDKRAGTRKRRRLEMTATPNETESRAAQLREEQSKAFEKARDLFE